MDPEFKDDENEEEPDMSWLQDSASKADLEFGMKAIADMYKEFRKNGLNQSEAAQLTVRMISHGPGGTYANE